VGDGRVSAILIETPANPTNALVDIAELARLADALGDSEDRPIVIVDNTFMGPLWQHPLEHGADLVLYSATKFIGGHSDVIAGACLGNAALIDRVRTRRTFMGPMASPWTGWLLLRSLETLKMRMTAQVKNARYVAAYLKGHPKVTRMHYLGLIDESDEMYDVYCRQCLAPGSMMAFDVVGEEAGAFRLLNALQLVKLAVSLGGTESLAQHPATMTHAEIPEEDRIRMGIGPAMVRLSIGVEHYEDIVADLEEALAQV
jgi:methionine-gamma-lyase